MVWYDTLDIDLGFPFNHIYVVSGLRKQLGAECTYQQTDIHPHGIIRSDYVCIGITSTNDSCHCSSSSRVCPLLICIYFIIDENEDG